MSDYERIEKVILHLKENYLDQPSLGELANVAGLSEFHFHRLFVRWAGTTPKAVLKYLTVTHAKGLLASSRDLLDASLGSGLSGPSRLHDLFVSVEAVTPGEFKLQGRGVEIQYGIHSSPFGDCLIGATNRGVCHLSFIENSKALAIDEMKREWSNARFTSAKAGTAKIAKTIFASRSARNMHVILRGTPFQLKVWEALLRIPSGCVLSYSDIAMAIGSPKASRAVGNAIGRNSIAYLIPCHRVIREAGVCGHYRWGDARKRAVLAWEAAIATRIDI